MSTPAKAPGGGDFVCNTTDLARSLRWVGTLNDENMTAVNLTDSGNQANTNALVITPRSLPVGRTAIVTFTACYADSVPDPALCGSASASFKVVSTPLVATLAGVNAIVGARKLL